MTKEMRTCVVCDTTQPVSEYHYSNAAKVHSRLECNTCRSFYNRIKHYGSYKNSAGRRVIKLADGTEMLVVDAVRGLRRRGYKYTSRRTTLHKPDISDEKATQVLEALEQRDVILEPPAKTKEDE